MKVINISLDSIVSLDDISVCLGYFDAFHSGHLALIEEAKKMNKPVALMTMEPNPKSFFVQSDETHINSFADKCEILEALKVDYFIILKTEKKLLDLTKEEFIDRILIPLGAKNVVCGFDYTFGRFAKGNANFLKEYAHGRYVAHCVEQVKNEEGMKISSSLIHQLISLGQVDKANKYLFRPYQIKGNVIKGNQIGRTIGFKTANIVMQYDYLKPKNGVYAGYVLVNDKKYKAMINVGTHPTVGNASQVIVEPHILDFDENIYDKEIIIIFCLYLREEKKFASLDELINQLNHDKNQIRDLIY